MWAANNKCSKKYFIRVKKFPLALIFSKQNSLIWKTRRKSSKKMKKWKNNVKKEFFSLNSGFRKYIKRNSIFFLSFLQLTVLSSRLAGNHGNPTNILSKWQNFLIFLPKTFLRRQPFNVKVLIRDKRWRCITMLICYKLPICSCKTLEWI